MSNGSKLIAEQYRSAELVKRSFGDVFYVAPAFGVFPGGLDVTTKLQALVNKANAAGRTTIVMPSGVYKVTSISHDENIVYFGDGARFIGGYNRKINSLSVLLSIDEKLDRKASTDYVDKEISETYASLDVKINSITSGAPKGTYPTLAALQSAFPTGNSNIYVVLADGKWYYWNGTSWTAGGVYQSTGIANDSVGYNELSKNLLTAEKTYKVYYKYANDELLVDFVFDLSQAIIAGSINTNSQCSLEYDFYTDDANVKRIGYRLFLNNSSIGADPLGGDATYGNSLPYVDVIPGSIVNYSGTKGPLPTTSYNYAHVMVSIDLTDKSNFSLFYIKNIKLTIGDTGFSVLTTGLFFPDTGSYLDPEDYFFKMLATRGYVDKAVAGQTSRWSDAKWAVVGDSITEHNFRTTKNYQDYISDRIGCIALNYGMGGTGYYAGDPGMAIKDRIGSIDSSADLVTIFAGTNDWALTNIPLGVFGDTDPNATMYGAIYYTINALINRFPTKILGVITPLPRIENYGSFANLNGPGYTLEQLSNAIIKVCQNFSLPCLDLYHNSNIPVWNSTANDYYFTPPGQHTADGLHPNDNGHKVIADKVLAFINYL